MNKKFQLLLTTTLTITEKAKLSSAEKYREDSGGSLQRKQYCMYNIF